MRKVRVQVVVSLEDPDDWGLGPGVLTYQDVKIKANSSPEEVEVDLKKLGESLLKETVEIKYVEL